MGARKRVTALISGRGSNLECLLEAQEDSASTYQIDSVFSDCEAPGLDHARRRQIEAKSFLREQYPSRTLQRAAIFNAVRSSAPDLIILAGFMMIIPAEYTGEFFGRLINIHPSLLPEFPGLHTHQRAIAAGGRYHGCSTHFVDQGVDTGPLIAQARCEIVPGDTEETLAARVLTLEHRIFPWTVNQLAADEISLKGRTVHYSTRARESAAHQHFILPG